MNAGRPADSEDRFPMVKNNSTERAPLTYWFPEEPTKNSLRGIRNWNDEGGAGGAAGGEPAGDDKVDDSAKDDAEKKPEEKAPEADPKTDPSSQAEKDKDKGEPKPPWGSDEDFTPTEAWKKIQDKEADSKRHQQTAQYRLEIIAERDATIAEKDKRISELEEQIASRETGDKKATLLSENGFDGTDPDLLEELTGSDEEVWKKKIAKWVKLRGGVEAPIGGNVHKGTPGKNLVDDQKLVENFRKVTQRRF